VWDKFFDFLFCDEEPSREEVQRTLGTLGIDIAPGLRKIHQALKASQARANLKAAKEARPSLVQKIGQVFAPATENLREGLRDLITRKLSGTQQLAFFRKLEEAASDNDLKSLLEDMDRLEKLSEEK
jgi:hypothetical protein